MTDIKYGRKRRGIKLELKKKINEWLESIEDVETQEIAKQHCIVTGGSIASMLLGEKVNDFDIYFRTKKAAKKVAKYYVEKFNSTNELKSKNNYVPRIKESEDRITVWMQSAGIAAEDQDTYNYFETMGEDEAIQFAESTAQDIADTAKPKYRPVFMSENAITLSDKIQLIVRFYGEPDQIHNNYDFVHATCYWDHQHEYLVLPAKALEALLSRTLVYSGSLYPIASIFRMKKFIERGWRITAGQQLKIMWQISELDLTKYEILREQLTGVDMAYMWELIRALQDVDPEKINSAYISVIIDRIFD